MHYQESATIKPAFSEPPGWEILFTSTGRLFLFEAKELYRDGVDVFQLHKFLSSKDLTPDAIAAILTQVELAAKARSKFGARATEMLFTKSGLEQASRTVIAQHHALKFAATGATKVVDMGSGIGSQSMAFLDAGLEATAIEIDNTTAKIARHNLNVVATADNKSGSVINGSVINTDALNYNPAPGSLLFFDPARRTAGLKNTKRLSSAADYSPPLDFAFALLRKHGGAIKLGPGFERELIPEDAGAEWISVAGELSENVLWFGDFESSRARRSAIVINDSGTHELNAPADMPDAAVREIGDYLYEPDKAVIRARLIGQVADEVAGGMLDPNIAYITSDKKIETPFARGFRILQEVPSKQKQLASFLKKHDIGTLEIKKRGVDIDPHTLRKSLRLNGPKSATVIMTRIGQKHVSYLVERI